MHYIRQAIIGYKEEPYYIGEDYEYIAPTYEQILKEYEKQVPKKVQKLMVNIYHQKNRRRNI